MSDAARRARTTGSNGSRRSFDGSVARNAGSTGLPKLDLLFFWSILRKHWRWMFPLGILLSLIGCGTLLSLFKPTYESRFRLEVDPSSSYVVFADRVAGVNSEFVDFQKQIMLSNSFLEKVVADPSVASTEYVSLSKDPVSTLRSSYKISSNAGNRIIDLKFQDRDPKIAAIMVNVLADEYLRSRRSIEATKSAVQERNVAAALQKAESEVRETKERLKQLRVQSAKNEASIISTNSRGDTSYVDEIRMQRMELQSNMTIMQLNLSAMREEYESDLANPEGEATKQEEIVISDDALDKDVIVVAARSNVEAAKQRLNDLVSNTAVGPKNPIYVNARRALESAEAQYAQVRESRRSDLTSRGLITSRDSRLQKINGLTSQIEDLKTRKNVLEEQMKAFLTSFKEAKGNEVEMEFAESELEEWLKIRDQVHNRRIRLMFEREATDAVREMERAVPARVPLEELPYRNMGICSVASMLLPLVLGFLLELRYRKVDDAHGLESRSRLAVLGEISTIPVASTGKLSRRSKTHARELRLFEESVDALSTALILREDLKNAKVFTITSALSGEGKTSVSCQLVVSLGRATGAKVLLVDGDLRAPDIHHVFGRQMNPGLVGYLNGVADWRELIDREWNDSIHLLKSGILKGSPHRLLSNGRFESFIKEAREEYDFIVIDTPPVLPASESLLFAKVADAVLMCALRDKSRVEQLIQAYHRLEASGAAVVGSVLSGVPVREYASYYGDYYASKV